MAQDSLWETPAAKTLRVEPGFELDQLDRNSTPGFTGNKADGERLLEERGAVFEKETGAKIVVNEVPFAEIFASFNSNPNDDPGGAGTCPGANFEAFGLDRAWIDEIFAPYSRRFGLD